MPAMFIYFLYAAFLIALILLLKYFVFEKIILKNLHARPVFVTGCDSGFGQKLVLKLLRHNVPTVAGCFTGEGERKLKELCENLPGKLWTVDLDVRSSESVSRARDFVEKRLDGKNLWGVVCNAGVGNIAGPDDFLTVDDYRSTGDVNIYGVIRTCHAFKPLIKKSGGRIVIMSSMLGRLSLPYLGPYVVSKYAIEGYADTLRLESSPFGFSVHVLEPGFFKTNITDSESVKENYAKLWSKVNESVKEEYGEIFYREVLGAIEQSLSLWVNESLEPVVDAYFHALTARFPRYRYVVGSDAKFLFVPMSLLTSGLQRPLVELLRWKENMPLPLVCRRRPGGGTDKTK